MKTTFLKSILALAFIASFTSSCVNDDDYETPQVDCIETTLQKTKEVSEISASSTVTQYLQNDVIEAYVVSSDKDASSLHMLKTGQVVLRRFNTSIDLQCVAGL
jgi:hypothetical protein